MTSDTIITTKEQIEKVFAEWDKQRREQPDDFVSLDEYNPSDAADYFVKLLHQVN